MKVDELLRRAWEAVELSGIPDPHKGIALKEAVALLRSNQELPDDGLSDTQRTRTSNEKRNTDGQRRRLAPDALHATAQFPDRQTFFGKLAHESGIAEGDLSDLLNLTDDGKVQILVATKDLGKSLAEQARTSIVLVASARAKGLDENPVNAEAVREEMRRKHCYSQPNFAVKHLGPLKGFNAGSSPAEILLSSKWLNEFAAAVARSQGSPVDTTEPEPRGRRDD